MKVAQGQKENRKRLICVAAMGLLLLSQSFFHHVSAQNTHWEIGLNGSYMFHNFSDLDIVATGVAGMDVTWMSRKDGDSYWRLMRRYPSFGVRTSFYYIPQGIAGHRIGVAGIVRTPLTKHLDYNLGVGLSTFTRAQCFTGDPENIFVSSALNCLIDVGFSYRIGEHVMFTAGLTHSSNGMLHRPNKGLNFFQAGMAVKLGNDYEHNLDWEHAHERITSVPTYTQHEIGATLSPAVVMSGLEWQKGYFFCYDISLNYIYRFNPVYGVGGAVDLWYNDSHTEQMKVKNVDYPLPLYISAMPFWEGSWGHLSLRVGIGPVLYASSLVRLRFYERVGAYYNFGSHYVGAGINAHSGVIEFIEWSYGFRIPLKKK